MFSKINTSGIQGAHNQTDEIGDAALDAVSGGQGAEPIQRLDTMVVTAKRIPASPVVQKLDTMVVTATRLPPDAMGTQIASVAGANKKGS